MQLLQRLRDAGAALVGAQAVPSKRTGHGEVASGLSVLSGIPEIDYLDELDFPDYIREFKKLANDAAVAKELRSNTLPLLTADTSVEPASDDARDMVIAEFVGANLYQQEGEFFGREYWCQTPWMNRLRDALRFLQNGFSMFQKIFRQQGRFTVYDKIKYLQPESIERWEFDETDAFLGVQRTYTRSDGKTVSLERVDASELFVYTWDQEGSNILGKPLIRPMWRDFQFKDRVLKLVMIDKQKTSVGIPFFKLAAEDGDTEIPKAEQVAKSMRSGNYERLWVRMREGQDFGWKEGGQSTKGMPELVRLFDEQIGKAGGTSFLDFTVQGAGGSRGSTGTAAAFGGMVQSAITRVIEAYELAFARELVDLNWTGVVAYPHPKMSDVDPFEKTRSLPEMMANMGRGKAITKTFDTENEIRRRYAFMEIDEEQYDELNAPAPVPPMLPGGEEEEEEAPAKSGGDTEEFVTPPQLGRGRVRLQAEEQIALLARAMVRPEEIRKDLERIESVYYSALRSVQRDMVSAIVEHVRTGKLNPRQVKDVRVPFQDELKERLLAIVKSARDFGRDQVAEELKRQLQILARRPIPNPSTRRGAISFSNDQAQVLTELDVTNLVARLQAQTVAEHQRLMATGASKTEIATGLDDYLGSISDRQIADMSRSATAVHFNQGRNVGILEHRGQLEEDAVRVEVDPDDPNTCDPCQQLNGARFKIGTQAYYRNQPPAGCEGKLRCRGFYAVVARAA